MSEQLYGNSKGNRDYRQEQKRSPYSGIYLGIVRQAAEETRSGMLNVFIPALSKDPTDQASATYRCFWSSPFAGSTNPASIGKDIKKYDTGQKSYGMWMVPPDVGNTVLVCFADGNVKMPYVIATLFPDQLNHMVPGMPMGTSHGGDSMLPVIEKNKRDDRQTHNDAVRPVAVDIAEPIVKQGLINDPVRGVGTSGARRESPSEVFGILTPGPRDPEDFNHRLGGHQFIMDDNLESRLVRIRTAKGAQLLLDDTNGIIYLINQKGTAWFEISDNGDIQVFSEGSISMRAKGNFNLRADQDINIEAGKNIKMKAAGGVIHSEATDNIMSLAGKSHYTTATDNIDIQAGKSIASQSGKDYSVKSGSNWAIQAGSAGSIQTGSAFGVNAGGSAGITASTILLNSGGPGPIAARAPEKTVAIATTGKQDVPPTPPAFNREAANRGEGAMPTNGKRTGSAASITTIVGCMPTAEPFAGHNKVDGTKTPARGQVRSK